MDDGNESRILKWKDAKINEWRTGGKLRTRFPREADFRTWMDGQIRKAIQKQQQSRVSASLKLRELRDKVWAKVHTWIPATGPLSGKTPVTSWKEFYNETKATIDASSKKVLTDMLTWPLTLSNALHGHMYDAKAGARAKTTVHVLGYSDTVEGERFKHAFSPLADLLPPSRFQKVDIVCVGPEVGSKLHRKSHDVSPTVRMHFLKALYHNSKGMMKKMAVAPVPDLVVAFNSGMWCLDARKDIDGSEWSSTIEQLLDSNQLAVLTARSEAEMQSCTRVFSNQWMLKGKPDFTKRTFEEYGAARLIPGKVHFVLEPCANPFRSLVQSHVRTDPGARNAMWAVIKGRSSSSTS